MDLKTLKKLRQLELEKEAVTLGVQRFERMLQATPNAELPAGQLLLKKAITPLVEAIDTFKVPKQGGGRLQSTRSFMTLFDSKVIAFCTLRRVINALTTTQPIQSVCLSVVSDLIDHLEYEKYKAEAPGHLYVVEKDLTTTSIIHRKRVIMRAKRLIGIEDEMFSQNDRLHIGTKLVELVISATGLIERKKVSERGGKNTKVYLAATPSTLAWMENKNATFALLTPMHLPMVVPPRDWTTPFDGGYLSNETTQRYRLVKTRSKAALLKLADYDMPEVYKAINGLQKVAYRANKSVYDVMLSLWESGGGLAGLPGGEIEPLPETPWDSDSEFESLKAEKDPKVGNWKRSAALVYDRRIKTATKRISVMAKLSMVKKYILKEEEVYFTWTLDWRGRAYPMQTYVNPQADDSGKALIEYAKGKPLGDRGSYWLAVQGANTFGEDKVSFDDRVEWVLQNERAIVAAAENPLDCKWWMDADKPFCFLAFCFEWAEYLKVGESFVSHLPIAMDGSCNGLQHFSAMLKDEVGGSAVNLTPQGTPADIYSEVAAVVNRYVIRDAEAGIEPMAPLWMGKIDRSICKRGVMTTPYGAKKFGLALQLQDELAKRLAKEGVPYLDTLEPNEACIYLAGILWTAIGEVVIAARQAMGWLQDVMKVACEADCAIEWKTPIGFVAYQHYREVKQDRIQTFWGQTRLTLTLNRELDKTEVKRMVSSVSPNFVHSLDASHMMSTWNALQDEGIESFTPVHDSFGTHACDVDRMNKAIRETFVEQYQGDMLKDFKEQVALQLPASIAEKIPTHLRQDSLDLEAVKQSMYFFA